MEKNTLLFKMRTTNKMINAMEIVLILVQACVSVAVHLLLLLFICCCCYCRGGGDDDKSFTIFLILVNGDSIFDVEVSKSPLIPKVKKK
jgi:hypothetical protein